MEDEVNKSPCGCKFPYFVARPNPPTLQSPSSVHNYTTTTSPARVLMATAHAFQSPTTTPTQQTLKSPASNSNIPLSSSGSPNTHSTMFKTPSPSSGQIRPWLLATCDKSPVKHGSPVMRSLKLKSPKSEIGDCSARAANEEKSVLLGRPLYKRIGAPLNYPNSSTYAKCMKLFNAPSDATPTPVSLPKLVEVVDISDDDGQAPNEHGNPSSKGGCMENDVNTDEVRRAVAILDNATQALFTDVENIVFSIGQMMEATITICNFYTRGV